jgi:peptide/nickel transport system substrate-binding protein
MRNEEGRIMSGSNTNGRTDALPDSLTESRLTRRNFVKTSAGVIGGGLLYGAVGGGSALARPRFAKKLRGPAAQDIIVWDVDAAATNLNPIGSTNNEQVTNVRCWITNTLLRPGKSAELSQYTPDLAVAVPTAAKGSGGKVYNVKLRTDAVFSNGQKFTANDVVTTFNTIVQPSYGSIWAGSVIGVKSVDAVNAHTVRFELSEALNPFVFVNMLASIPIVSAAQAADKATLATDPIGTGAFKIKSVVPNQEVVLVPNPHYFRKGLPKVKGINYTVVPDDTTRVVDIVNGQGALTSDVPFTQLAVLEGKAKVFSVKSAPTRFYMLTNALKPGLSDINLRQAMAYSIDREAIINTVFGGKATVGGSCWSPNTAYFDHSVNVGHYSPRPNLTKAKAFMAKAKNVPSSISVTLLPGTVYSNAATILQANWQAIGINLTINQMDIADAVANLFSRPLGNPNSYDLFLLNDILGTGPLFGFSYITGTFLVGANVNLWNVSDPTLQGNLATLVSSTNKAEVQKAATAIQVFDLANLYETCIVYTDYLEAEGVPLSGYTPSPVGGLPYGLESAKIV